MFVGMCASARYREALHIDSGLLERLKGMFLLVVRVVEGDTEFVADIAFYAFFESVSWPRIAATAE